MAKPKIWNEATGQYETDPNADFAPVDTSQIGAPGTNTGIAGPAPATQAAPFNRQTFRDASMARPVGMSAADFISANPQISAGVVPYQGSKDKYIIPGTNEVIDLTINSDANGHGTGNGWSGQGYNAFGVPDAPGTPAQTAAPAAAQPAAAPQNDFQNSIRALLLQKLQEFGQPTSPNDPIIAGQTEAFRNERTRSADQERAQMAERAAFQGLLSGGQSSGAFDTTVQGINEQAGQDVSGFKAQLMGRELENRRSQLASMLSLAVQSGDQESARSLQLQIAQMDAELRKMGLAQQGSQFNAQLGQQQSQFNDTFGAQQAQQYTDNTYRDALLGLFGG